MLEHPESHFVSDHIATVGDVFVAPERTVNDGNKIGLEERGEGSPLLMKRSQAAWM